MSDIDISKPDIDMSNDSLDKGTVRDGKQLIAWDCIQECNLDECPIRHKCTYKTSHGAKCALQVTYIQTLTDTIFNTYRYCNDEVLFKIGMHLVPLYSQLCRQKIVEKSVVNLAYEDAKGVTRIHPIYKEIRETLKVITVLWREMGFNGGPPGSENIPTVGKPGFGDANHYTNISANADNKRNLIR